MVILPKNSEELTKFCHWVDITQVHPVTNSCFKRLELAEDKNFVFWFLDGQLIMTNKEFPFPKNEKYVTVEKFKKFLEKNKEKYSNLIFTHG